MKQCAFSFVALFLFINLNAQNLESMGDINKDITPFNDARDAMNGVTTVHLQNQVAWQQFIQHYPGWGASFDRYTQLPHRAFGTPITFAAGGNDAVAKALVFLQQEFAGFHLPINELVVTRNYNDGKYINVDFKQIHANREVLWSRINIRFTQDLKIILVGLDVHRNIPNVNATITPADAIQKAEQAITTTITNSTVSNELKLFPYPVDGKYEYRLVYEVNVHTINDNKTPGDYQSYVDANSGEILYRQNEVKFFDAKVKGDVHPVNQYTAAENRPMKNMKVKVGTTTYYTDSTGVANLPSGVNATISLEGKWAKVLDDGGGATAAASYLHTFAASGDSTTFDITAPHANDRGVNVYYHVNEIHDFMKSKFPLFTVLDIALPANVDITTGTCNAFYTNNVPDINFYEAGGGCNAFSYVGDVMSHEYGHGINYKFYSSQGATFSNGAMGEGYSDTWANCILKTGIIGLGYNSSAGYIRRYDMNPKVYPQDIQSEVHADGEIIAGAWWDVGVNWGSIDSMSDLFAISYYGLANGPSGTEGKLYFDILVDALTYDDDNSNINDGTPHFNAIVTAFATHGIYLLSNTTLDHTSPGSISASAPFTISADAITDFPAFLGNLKMIYRLKGSTVSDTMTMTKSGNTYTCQFPASVNGNVYEYVFAIFDNSNVLTAFHPSNSAFSNGFTKRNIPYYLMIGYHSAFTEPFDNISTTSLNWTIGNTADDNATAGRWIVALPISSKTNGAYVQTGKDHTTGSGKCAVTGNAIDSTTAPTSADVDGGRTTLITESYNLATYNKPVISYWRWFSNSQGTRNNGKDLWRVWISYDNGSNWNLVEKTYKPDVSWRRNIVVADLTQGTTAKLMFTATDTVYTGVTGAWVEAAVDDIEILELGDGVVGVQNVSELQASIYPNPASNEITIVTPENGILHYSIVNTIGETILHEEKTIASNSLKVNSSILASGIYFVKLEMNHKTSVHRLVITK